MFGASAGVAGLPEPVAVACGVLQQCSAFLESLHGPHMNNSGRCNRFNKRKNVYIYIYICVFIYIL